MEACAAAVLEAEGRIDVLVNNAGYGSFGAIENVSIEEARRQLEVNVFGLARLTQLVLPHMREQRSGTIINVSSIAGKIVLYFGGWYHVSKFAVEAFSDALRMEVKPFGIQVALIEPGGIKTDWGIIAADHLPRRRQPPPQGALPHRFRRPFRRFPPLTSSRPLVGRAHARRRPEDPVTVIPDQFEPS